MERVPLLGGSDSRRSIIANAQRRVNYFPELNREDSPTKFTMYQRPGLTPRMQGGPGAVRILYRASSGAGYTVIGTKVYSINSRNNALTQIGTIQSSQFPVSMIDNGIDILLVDGTPNGYTIHLGTNAFAGFVDSSGLFQGADRVDTIDTFIIWNMPGTNRWGSTLSNTLTIDPTYFAAKSDYPDPLRTLIVNRHEIVFLGDIKSEIWYDAGNAQFPFAELPGAYIEHGIVAKYSLASADISVFWLGQDLQGSGYVFRQRGYDTKRVSNHAVEYAIRKIRKSVGIADAIAYTYQQDGHLFYVLSFPAGDQTWVYDDSIPDPQLAWSQRAWTDQNGVLHRDRTNCAGFINGMNLVGDWENGTIYELDLDSYSDTAMSGETSPMTCICSFGHIQIAASSPQHLAQPAMTNGRKIQFNAFYADLEVGEGVAQVGQLPPEIGLRWSTDRGKTFGNTVLQSAGAPGEFRTWPTWRAQGIARDMIFELSHTLAGPAALNGAWASATVLTT